jgi:hypothetical protein
MGGAGSSHLATINLAAAHIPLLYKAIPIPDSSTGLLQNLSHVGAEKEFFFKKVNHIIEEPAKTQTKTWLASSLLRALKLLIRRTVVQIPVCGPTQHANKSWKYTWS